MPDGTKRNPLNQTYACAVRMEHKGEYINKKRNMKKGIGREKERKKNRQKKEGERKRKEESVALFT